MSKMWWTELSPMDTTGEIGVNFVLVKITSYMVFHMSFYTVSLTNWIQERRRDPGTYCCYIYQIFQYNSVCMPS